jgi:DNA-binding transcriptional regulator YbjK
MKRTLAQRKDRASYSAKREKIVKAAGPVLKRYGLDQLRAASRTCSRRVRSAAVNPPLPGYLIPPA